MSFNKRTFYQFFVLVLTVVGLILLVDKTAARASSGGTGSVVTELTRVSVSSNGQEGNDQSIIPAISADGRFVAFYSLADNLVVSDTNGFLGWDVFVYDRETAVTERVSVSSEGGEGNGPSTWPDISADGRFVVFSSLASNLVLSDTNEAEDVFVHDRLIGETTRVSVSTVGEQGNADSNFATISDDGRFIAFDSNASNLVPDDTNGLSDVFVYDRLTQTTERVSISTNNSEGSGHSTVPSISSDGRFVAFDSNASNLVPDDNNTSADIFVRDRQTGETTRVSLRSDGQEANGNSRWAELSADGRFVAFLSYATDLVEGVDVTPQVYLHDRQTGITTLVSVTLDGQPGNDKCGVLDISSDGRFVTFGSHATNLVTNDTNGEADVFVHDRITSFNARVSITAAGQEGNGLSWGPAIVDNGMVVAYWSEATNLVEEDNNSKPDIFVSEWQLHQVLLPFVTHLP